MFADFWTEIVSTNLLSSFELRIIAVILKQLNFDIWMVIDCKSIAKQLNLDEIEVAKVVQKLIKHKIIEYKGESVKPSCYRYRLNSNFGWKKSFDWVFPDGIDWQAFLTSFQKLQRKFELKIRAIENKSGGILVVHLEVSALANRTEVAQCLKHEYKVKLKALKETYRIKHSNQEIASHQQNSTNLLKIIELIVNTNNNLHNRVDIKAIPQSESVKLNLSHNNINNQGKTAKNSLPITPKQKQTLAEAVAEREKLSKQLDLTKVERISKVDDSVDTPDVERIDKVDDSVATPDVDQISKVDDSVATPDVDQISKVDDSVATPDVDQISKVDDSVDTPDVERIDKVDDSVDTPDVERIGKVDDSVATPDVDQISKVDDSVTTPDVDQISKVDDSVTTPDHNSFLKRKIKARLNKHCH